MTIEFDDRVRSIWYVELPAGVGNFLACIKSDPGELTYRFRYYKGDQSKQFEKSEDESSWYSLIGPLDEIEKAVVDMTGEVFKGLAVHSIFRKPGETTDDFLERFEQLPFVQGETRVAR